MSQQKPEDNLRELADAATTSIRQQQEKGASLAATRPKPSVLKKVFTAVLLLAFAGLALMQYPRFQEPFGRPDPNKDSTVAEADLTMIAMVIDSYQVSQGKYPTSLDQVRLPDALGTFVAEQRIAYRQTEKAYTLDWTLPNWHAVFDGETGKVDVVPINGAK